MDEQQLFLRKLNRRTRFTQFLVWIALFFTAIGIAAGYKNWLRIHEKAKTSLAEIVIINEKITNFAKKEQVRSLHTSIEQQLTKNAQQFENTLVELRQLKQSTKYIANTVYKQVEEITNSQQAAIGSKQLPTTHDWSFSEIHFLLQSAIHVLALQHDKQAAITALELADNLLLKKGSSKLFPLRKQISQDIALLHQFIPPDVSKLSEQITNLQQLLEPKKEINQINASSDRNDNKEIDINTKSQEKDSLANKFLKSIKDVVVIKKFDKPLQNEMDEEAKDTLFQLLSLKLETLRIMLLQKQDKNYHEQISRIKALITKYYSKNKLTYFINKLTQLDRATLNPDAPDISTSLKLLESILSKT